jgi:hypothetical protein
MSDLEKARTFKVPKPRASPMLVQKKFELRTNKARDAAEYGIELGNRRVTIKTKSRSSVYNQLFEVNRV